MLKNKVLIIIVLGFLIPQVTFASWWNPFSWFTQEPKQEIKQATTTATFQINDLPTIPKPSTNTKSKKTSIVDQSSNFIKEISQPKQDKVVQPSTFTTADGSVVDSNGNILSKSQQSVVQTPIANSTLCNGIYYSTCSIGNDLVCPTNGGKAYCQISQQQEQTNKAQTLAYLQSQLQMYQNELIPIQDEAQNYQNQWNNAGCSNISQFLTQATGEQGQQALQKSSNCAAISQAKLSTTQQMTPIYDAIKVIQQKIFYLRGY